MTTSSKLFFMFVLATLISSRSTTAAESVRTSSVKPVTADKTAPKNEESAREEARMGAVTSPFPSCANFVMVADSDFQKNQSFWKDFEKSCQPAKRDCSRRVQVIPDIGMFKSFQGVTGKNLSSQLTSVQFLDRVAERSIEKMQSGIKRYEKMQICLRSEKQDDGCKGDVSAMQERLRKNQPGFRNAVSLMAEADLSTIINGLHRNSVDVFINRELSPTKSKTIMARQPPLTDAEMATVRAEMNQVMKDSAQEWLLEIEKSVREKNLVGEDATKERARLMRVENQAPLFRARLDRKRASATAEYLKALKSSPELGYMTAEDSEKVIGEKIEKMIEDAKQALRQFESAKSSRKEQMSSDKMDSSLLRFAGNTLIIEEMLDEEKQKAAPSSCAVATAVFNELQSSKSQSGLLSAVALVGLPVGTALAPVALGRAIGAGATVARATAVAGNLAIAEGIAGGMWMTKHDIESANNTELLAKQGAVRWEDAKDEVARGGASWAMAPLNFIGAPAVVGALSGLGGKVLGRFALSAGAKGQLGSKGGKGLSSLVESAQKGDAAAAKEVMKAATQGEKMLLGREATQSENEAFQAAGQSGVLGSSDAPDATVVLAYSDASKKMPPKDRESFAARFGRLMRSVQTTGSPERVQEVKSLAVPLAQIAPNPQEAGRLLTDPSWDAQSLRMMRKLVKHVLAKGASKPADVEREMKAALLTATKGDQKRANNLCVCSGLCRRTVTENNVEPDRLDVSPGLFAVCSLDRSF